MSKVVDWTANNRTIVNELAALAFFKKYPFVRSVTVEFKNEFNDSDFTRRMEISHLDIDEMDEKEAALALGCTEEQYEKWGMPDEWEFSDYTNFPRDYLIYEEDDMDVRFVNPGPSNLRARAAELLLQLNSGVDEYINGL